MRRSLAVAAVLLLLAGCTSARASNPAPRHRQAGLVYVALGDSYSAGPLIPTTDVAGGCFRSDHNYPALFWAGRASRAGQRIDVTCSAARTRDLDHPQKMGQATVKPQFDALTARAGLVTIGIGGNDFGLFGRFASGCGTALAVCTASTQRHLPAIGRHVATALREIHRRAPAATVVLVGYLRLAPTHGTCAKLGLTSAQADAARRISRGLAQELKAAAARTDSTYLDAYRLSRGHDVCSADPWVNGKVSLEHRAAAYHPFEAGMRAVAAALGRLVPASS